ncbi:uncharacterized protein LOC136038882 isoform X2 [Artemia franciscana]|uniref:uncharacterized protein LOC136038882 isoform X2 n=1 Tax=Artemia franciscana TaxID=6661 RepID=UPI0032DB6104
MDLVQWLFLVNRVLGVLSIFTQPNSDIVALKDSVEVEFDINVTNMSIKLTYLNGNISILEDSLTNLNESFIIPCDKLKYGGVYIITVNDSDDLLESDIIVLHWPKVRFEAPHSIEIYRSGFVLTLSLTQSVCYVDDIDFTLELVFCGPRTDNLCVLPVLQSLRTVNDLYSKKLVQLKYDCQTIGKPGLYYFQLLFGQEVVAKSDPIFANINEDYFLSFVGNSIFPCEEEVVVEYNHPTCILDKDRIRIYSRNFSSVPGFEYLVETPLPERQRYITYPCSTFDENFDEYCFTYVSASADGSSTDLIEKCVPTWADSVNQAWSNWSHWSACSASCGPGAVRSRHRICMPSSRKRFCMGSSVETELCELPPCYPVSGYELTRIENVTCGCGCSINIAFDKIDIIHGTSEDCHSQQFWLLKADNGKGIQVYISFFNSSCCDGNHILQVRGGPSLTSDLLFEYTNSSFNNSIIESSSSVALIAFVHNHVDNCSSSFVATVQAIDINLENFSRRIDTSLPIAISLPEIFVMATFVFIFTGICILFTIYGCFGVKRSENDKTSVCESSTLFSTVSHDIPNSNSNVYVPVPLTPKQNSLPNLPSFGQAFLGSLKKSCTYSPKTFRRTDYLPLNKPDSSQSSCTFHENPLYETPQENKDENKTLAEDNKTVSQAEISRCGTDNDFELDYYDFDVHNATQVPGSNFGTEPALIAWALDYMNPGISYERIPMEAMTDSVTSNVTNCTTITTATFSNATDVDYMDEEEDLL